MAVVPGGGEKKILLAHGGSTFRLVLPGYRCEKCKVEFWVVEDARAHFARDAGGEEQGGGRDVGGCFGRAELYRWAVMSFLVG